MAKTPRKWSGARTPSALKRVRASRRRHAILQPRRSAAKTLVKKALTIAVTKPEGADPMAALSEAMSALDRAAKVGAIHPNAAARRKSRLARKVNAALAGEAVQTAARATKTTGAAAAAKAAKARIAASKAAKGKTAQTAAEKARVALSKSARAAAEGAPDAGSKATASKATGSKTTASKATGSKATGSSTGAGRTKKAGTSTTAAAAKPRSRRTSEPSA